MFRNLRIALSRWWVNFRKYGGDLVDVFKPKGFVEARLIYAHGPKKGQIARVIKGRNIVTNWLSVGGAAPTSGRDLLRRIIVPSAFSGSLAADANAVFSKIELGSGTTAEAASDTSLEAAIGGTKKDISDIVFDTLSPYVTFIAEWSESEANATISEASLLSARSPEDFLARKTFGSFSKTSDFVLEIRWQLRL